MSVRRIWWLVCRSVPRLVLEKVELREKDWQALASALSDSGCRVEQVGRHTVCGMNWVLLSYSLVGAEKLHHEG